mmetsp:Transcript_51895/g.89100  ORF Transcript_51895/g.89100 Transcript_51895/m.89100 type:complete len:188 (-) Transcript_51895:119-682(-)
MPRLSEQENYIRTKRGHRGGDSGGNVAEAQQQQQQQQRKGSGQQQGERRESAAVLFDLVYVDGGHDAATALSDGLLSMKLLKPGGYIIFDDCVDESKVVASAGSWAENVGVRTAVDGLLAAFGPLGLLEEVGFAEHGYGQCILRKGSSGQQHEGDGALNEPLGDGDQADRGGTTFREPEERDLNCAA